MLDLRATDPKVESSGNDPEPRVLKARCAAKLRHDSELRRRAFQFSLMPFADHCDWSFGGWIDPESNRIAPKGRRLQRPSRTCATPDPLGQKCRKPAEIFRSGRAPTCQGGNTPYINSPPRLFAMDQSTAASDGFLVG
jgi:hypothetical protein